MFDDNYIVEKKGIPLVGYFKSIKNTDYPKIFTKLHYHSDFELIYIKEGKARMIIGGETVFAAAGSLLIINPYEMHYGEILSEDFEYYCIDFDIKLLHLQSENALLEKKLRYRHCVSDEGLETFIKEIYSAYFAERENWQLWAIGQLMLLFCFLKTESFDIKPKRETVFAKNVIDYLNLNYKFDISSKTAAEYIGYEHSYFCRLFKRSFGLRFCDYLNEYRIEKAKELLACETVTETALKCGFSSLSVFSQVFKSYTGMRPYEFKKRAAALISE